MRDSFGLAAGRRLGDWVNRQAVGPAQEYALGFIAVPAVNLEDEGRRGARPATRPLPAGQRAADGQLVPAPAGDGRGGGVPHDLRGALAVYGGSLADANQILRVATPPLLLARLPV